MILFLTYCHFFDFCLGLRFADSQRLMELDIYVPDLKIAWEYQGQQHYTDSVMFAVSTERQQELDEEKRKKCETLGWCIV